MRKAVLVVVCGLFGLAMGSGCIVLRAPEQSRSFVEGPVDTPLPLVNTVGNGALALGKAIGKGIGGNGAKDTDPVAAFFAKEPYKSEFAQPPYFLDEKKLVVVAFAKDGVTFTATRKLLKDREQLVAQLAKNPTGSPAYLETTKAIAEKSSTIADAEFSQTEVAMRFISDQIKKRIGVRTDIATTFPGNETAYGQVDADIRELGSIFRELELRMTMTRLVPDDVVTPQFSLAHFGPAAQGVYQPGQISGLDETENELVRAILGEAPAYPKEAVAAAAPSQPG